MDTDELNQLIRSLNQGASSGRREADGPELELVRGEEPAGDLEQTAKLPPTGEEELPPGLVALLSETVRRGATDLLLVPGASPVVRVNGSLEKAGGGEAVSAQTAFDLLSPSLSADRRRRFHETACRRGRSPRPRPACAPRTRTTSRRDSRPGGLRDRSLGIPLLHP